MPPTIPGRKNLRFIGGTHHGETKPVIDSSNVISLPKTETEAKPSRFSTLSHRVESKQIDQRYVRRKVVIEQNTFKYTEECMVLENIGAYEAARLVLNLGLPRMQVQEMKVLAIRPSSVVKGLAYCEKTKTLDVTLNDTTYRYLAVPKETVFELVTDNSLGRAYGNLIRNKFECELLAAAYDRARSLDF